jgi:hypothetical protein
MKNLKYSFLLAFVFLFALACTETDVQPEVPVDAVAKNQDVKDEVARKKQPALVEDVTGTIKRKNVDGMGVPYTADLHIQEFISKDNDIYAVASLRNITGDNLPSNVKSLEGKTFHVPVENIWYEEQGGFSTMQFDDPTCPILFLELGPLNLDLLGLTVFLDQVTLVIGAEPGQGNLLGNLLCAVAGLLDPPGGPLQSIIGLLNDIIDILGTL